MQHNAARQPAPRLLQDGTLEIHIEPIMHAQRRHTKKQGATTKTKKDNGQHVQQIAPLGPKGRRPSWAKRKLQPDILMKTFVDNAETLLPNPATRATYLRAMTNLRRLNDGRPIKDLILPSPEPMLRQLTEAAKKQHIKAWTIKVMLTSLLTLMRSVLSAQAKSKPELLRSLHMIKQAHRAAKRFAETQLPDTDGWISADRLVAIRDAIVEPTTTKLMLGFLTATAPRVQYLYKCVIFAKEPDTNQRKSCEGSYLVLSKTSKEASIVYLCPNNTEVKVALPPMLVNLIRASIHQDPRVHLFEYARNGCTGQSYTQRAFKNWCSKTLKKVTGSDAASMKLCRQAFVTSYLSNPQTAQQRAQMLAEALSLTVKQVMRLRREVVNA